MRIHMEFQHIVHFWNDNENLSMQKLGHGKARVQYALLIKFRFSKKATHTLKVAFFQKVRFVFQISKSQKIYIPKSYPELEI